MTEPQIETTQRPQRAETWGWLWVYYHHPDGISQQLDAAIHSLLDAANADPPPAKARIWWDGSGCELFGKRTRDISFSCRSAEDALEAIRKLVESDLPLYAVRLVRKVPGGDRETVEYKKLN